PERISRRQQQWSFLTASRDRQACKNSFDDGLARHRLGFGFVANDNSMAQYVRADALHVLWRDVTAAVQEGVGAGTKGQINGGARRSAVANQPFQSQIVGGRFTRGPNDVHNVILHPVVDVDVV